MIANVFRLVLWGTLSIYSGAHPLADAPRIIANVAMFASAYFMLAIVLGTLGALVKSDPEPDASVEVAT